MQTHSRQIMNIIPPKLLISDQAILDCESIKKGKTTWSVFFLNIIRVTDIKISLEDAFYII